MQPREKLFRYGSKKLQSQELIAIILWTWIKGSNVFQVARKVEKLISYKQTELTLDDLLLIPWIGPVKAMQIIAGFELARRHYIKDDIRIESVADIVSQVSQYSRKQQEYLLTLTLDGAKRLIQKRVITIGLLDQSLAHPREIFSWAITDRAHTLILIHNHPSWNLYPSPADMRTTTRIQEVGKIVGIELLDHIIISKNWYYSFKENSLIS